MIIDDGVEYEVCWHGALHRAFPQPRIGSLEAPDRPRPLMDDIRTYLRRHPHTWRQVRVIAKALQADAYDVRDRLAQLVLKGEVVTEKLMFSPNGRRPEQRWCWKWHAEAPAQLLRRRAS